MSEKNEILEYLKTLSILYVEDDQNTREELEYFLEKKVKNLYVAKNGEEGYELYKKYNPDAVITDIQMPVLDGIELARLIKEDNAKVPILILTAFNDAQYLFEAIKLNINHYLTKPLNLKILVENLVDISKKIFLEKENREIQNVLEQYKSVVDENSIFFKINSEGMITYANECFKKISQYDEIEIIGSSFNQIHNFRTNEDIFSQILEGINSEKRVWKNRVENLNKSGDVYYTDMTVKPIFNLDGTLSELIALSTNITDLQKSKVYFRNLTQKSALDLSESIRISNLYKDAINSSNIIIRIDLDQNITYINDEFTRVLGYTKDDLIGMPYTTLKQPNVSSDEYKKQLKKYFCGEIYKGRISNYAKDGTIHHFNITAYPLKDKDGNTVEYLGIRHDITKVEELHQELVDTQAELIYRLGEIGETRSAETGNHVKRVAEYSKLFAQKLELDEEQTKILFIASPMHDIGKVGIPDAILNKNGKLDADEWEIMKTHSQIGYDILKSSNREILKAAAQISYTHHEKWNGTGYPRKLQKEEIPIFGRITALADVFDALGSDRVYKKAWPLDDILELFKKEKGRHFDPALVDIFFNNLNEFLKIKEIYED